MIVIAIIGLLAALAIPNFIRFQARARQSEARGNLKAIYTAQKAYYGNEQTYYDEFDQMGFAPEGNNRYSYFAGGGGSETRAEGAAFVDVTGASNICPLTGPPGIGTIWTSENWTSGVLAAYAPGAINGAVKNTGGTAPITAAGAFPAGGCCGGGVCDFCAVAIANIDNDTTLDQWFICSQNGAGGASVACGGGGVTPEWQEGVPVNDCDDSQY